MPLLHLGPAGDTFAGAFGGVAALLLIGGPIMLRWQRNRQQFQLSQTALEKGITRLPSGPPFWLVSLRQGLTALALGIALLIVGATGYSLTRDLSQPVLRAEATSVAPASTTMPIGSLPSPTVEPVAGRPSPPQPDPAMDEWHRLKAINTLSLMGGATGFVLTLLGLARMAFARTERRYYHEDDVPRE